MLKIYLCTVKYSLVNGEQEEHLCTSSDYIIREESTVAPKTKEWGAYTEEASRSYHYTCELCQTKKGIKAMYWNWDGGVYVKEWLAPNAKLIARCTYQEAWCSMKRLMELPAPDVIAYLKQEGLNLTMPS